VDRNLLSVLLLASTALAQPAQFSWPGGARAAVCLTYDDGVDVHLDHAIPDLEAVNLRGTFYIPGSSTSLAARMDEWRAAEKRGHELGNHSIFHPCLRISAKGARRAWLAAERELERYTVPQMIAELRAMNTTLLAVDGQHSRTYAYNCSDQMAGGKSFVDALRPLFPAARGGEDRELADPRTVDLHFVPSWMVDRVSGEEMIRFVEDAIAGGSLAVFMFHGVGGGHNINVDREAHRALLAWLSANRDRVWTDTFHNVMRHVAAERVR
jgi:sialate O-acetylesterase